jgi:hypothetical protein
MWSAAQQAGEDTKSPTYYIGFYAMVCKLIYFYLLVTHHEYRSLS